MKYLKRDVLFLLVFILILPICFAILKGCSEPRKKSSSEEVLSEQSAAEKPAAEQPVAESSGSVNSTANQTTAGQPKGGQPEGNQTTTEQTVIVQRQKINASRNAELKAQRAPTESKREMGKMAAKTAAEARTEELADRQATATDQIDIPNFPWPPPKASAISELPDNFLRGVNSEQLYLRDIDSHISSALKETGYFEKRYFAVPDGFAIVTRLEQINEDGTPKALPQRWAIDVGPLREFTFAAYFRALFTSNPGYFRVIVFIVTHFPFSQSDIKIDKTQAIKWLHEGLNKLPESIGKISYTRNYSCTALVYEFKKERSEEPDSVKILLPGRFTGRTHLVSSKLWNYLER